MEAGRRLPRAQVVRPAAQLDVNDYDLAGVRIGVRYGADYRLAVWVNDAPDPARGARVNDDLYRHAVPPSATRKRLRKQEEPVRGVRKYAERVR